jgi:lysyl-tRNA synthetase class 2
VSDGGAEATSALRGRLARRAALVARIRAFLDARGLVEVDTPLRAPATIPEAHIEALPCAGGWLLPSPEYWMKPLLTAGSGDIYQLAHAFRAGESGRLHAEEFLLCEWYRLGLTLEQLAAEALALLADCGLSGAPVHRRYEDAFVSLAGVHPLAAAADLEAAARTRALAPTETASMSAADWRDLLMACCVQPRLGEGAPLVLSHYPAEDSPLAATDPHDPRWAQRFEIFCRGMELANGCRERPGAPGVPQALPDCAGIALGVDRLLMLLEGAARLSDVLPQSGG